MRRAGAHLRADRGQTDQCCNSGRTRPGGSAQVQEASVPLTHVSGLASAGAALKKKSLHAAEQDTPRVQRARGE